MLKDVLAVLFAIIVALIFGSIIAVGLDMDQDYYYKEGYGYVHKVYAN